MKPNKSSDASKDVKLLELFPCQRIVQYNPSKTLELPISFTVKENKLKSKKKQSENKKKEFICYWCTLDSYYLFQSLLQNVQRF